MIAVSTTESFLSETVSKLGNHKLLTFKKVKLLKQGLAVTLKNMYNFDRFKQANLLTL